MIWLLSAILVVLVAILVVFILFLIRSPKSNPSLESKSLDEMVEIMRNARNTEEREKKDEELRAYALKHSKLPEMVISTNQEDHPRVGRDMIPYDLSDKEKEVLRQFYGRS